MLVPHNIQCDLFDFADSKFSLFAAKEFAMRFLQPVTWLSDNQKIYLSGSFGGL